MSAKTDRADRETLAYIGRNPGCKRTNGRGHASTHINVAAATRLINAGLIAQPTTTGRLYLTEAGTEAVWGPFPVTRYSATIHFTDDSERHEGIADAGGLTRWLARYGVTWTPDPAPRGTVAYLDGDIRAVSVEQFEI